MAIETFTKDPDARIDFGVDWSEWLDTGETLTTSTWITEAGITVVSESFDTTLTRLWLSGGTAGHQYSATNRVTTSQSRTDDRTINILVKER